MTLSQDKFTIYVTTLQFKSGKVGNLSSMKKPSPLMRVKSNDDIEERSIDIGSLDRVQKGQNTLKFELNR